MNHFPDFSSQNYQVIRELGRNREGGRISYLAENLTQQQPVVIKQFRFAQENASWEGFKVYEREIAILQDLKHPRIPRYLDSFETLDGFCMVQEYKDAPTLASKNSFEPQAIQQITISILEILVDLQYRIPPIFHRDIKPENILVDQNNRAYLIDFGLARVNTPVLAMSSVMAGTPGFMPPEELFHRPLTTASDLYSVGATIITMLTRIPATDISNLLDENYQFKFRHLVTGINPDFLQWLEKMVAPNLKDRYQNAATALQALQTIDITGQAKLQPSPSTHRYLIIAGIVLSSLSAINSLGFDFHRNNRDNNDIRVTRPANTTAGTPEEQWFNQIKPRCNAVEVITAISGNTYPQTPQGIGYAASCYALAGKIDDADRVIQQLPFVDRSTAAAVVFNIGHPIADAGDDKSAGPIMDLVIKYWPSNYMALYHAGMSAYILGDYYKADQHLQGFLRVYQQPDVWTNKAQSAISRMQQGIPADSSFSVHH